MMKQEENKRIPTLFAKTAIALGIFSLSYYIFLLLVLLIPFPYTTILFVYYVPPQLKHGWILGIIGILLTAFTYQQRERKRYKLAIILCLCGIILSPAVVSRLYEGVCSSFFSSCPLAKEFAEERVFKKSLTIADNDFQNNVAPQIPSSFTCKAPRKDKLTDIRCADFVPSDFMFTKYDHSYCQLGNEKGGPCKKNYWDREFERPNSDCYINNNQVACNQFSATMKNDIKVFSLLPENGICKANDRVIFCSQMNFAEPTYGKEVKCSINDKVENCDLLIKKIAQVTTRFPKHFETHQTTADPRYFANISRSSGVNEEDGSTYPINCMINNVSVDCEDLHQFSLKNGSSTQKTDTPALYEDWTNSIDCRIGKMPLQCMQARNKTDSSDCAIGEHQVSCVDFGSEIDKETEALQSFWKTTCVYKDKPIYCDQIEWAVLAYKNKQGNCFVNNKKISCDQLIRTMTSQAERFKKNTAFADRKTPGLINLMNLSKHEVKFDPEKKQMIIVDCKIQNNPVDCKTYEALWRKYKNIFDF